MVPANFKGLIAGTIRDSLMFRNTVASDHKVHYTLKDNTIITSNQNFYSASKSSAMYTDFHNTSAAQYGKHSTVESSRAQLLCVPDAWSIFDGTRIKLHRADRTGRKSQTRERHRASGQLSK